MEELKQENSNLTADKLLSLTIAEEGCGYCGCAEFIQGPETDGWMQCKNCGGI